MMVGTSDSAAQMASVIPGGSKLGCGYYLALQCLPSGSARGLHHISALAEKSEELAAFRHPLGKKHLFSKSENAPTLYKGVEQGIALTLVSLFSFGTEQQPQIS